MRFYHAQTLHLSSFFKKEVWQTPQWTLNLNRMVFKKNQDYHVCTLCTFCSIVTLDKVMCEHIWSIYSEYGTQKMRLHSQRAFLKIYFIWSNTRWFSLNLFKLFLRGQFLKIKTTPDILMKQSGFLKLMTESFHWLTFYLVLHFDRNCSEPQPFFLAKNVDGILD